ncbi:membrane protein US29 [Panine betaherpesvirus 2]|uniref:Membrane protein US29 n=1 Tax=Panine betaherpesvirus 2 TaxID=188763 RepID=Q8QRT1_9BETA|nr:membrane protein US29 [Panine betaherpesvirus 2]AAM00807.1 membrane protein US29 [Panine betaherpesvirus 2]
MGPRGWWWLCGVCCWWWVTFGCARTVTVDVVAPTVRAQSTVVYSEPPRSSSSSRGGTAKRRSTVSRWLRLRHGNASACVSEVDWTTQFFFSGCERYPSFVKLNGVKRWTSERQFLGEVAYYGGCCVVSGGRHAYVVLINGYGTATYGNALRLDFSRRNCTVPLQTYPRRLEIYDGQTTPSRCDPYRVYFYGLRCPQQLVLNASGGLELRRCPGTSPAAADPSRPRHRGDLEDELRGLCVDLLVCVFLLALLLLELIPMEAVRHPLVFWRRMALTPSSCRFERWCKARLRRLLGLPPPPPLAPPSPPKKSPSVFATDNSAWAPLSAPPWRPPLPSVVPDSPPPPYSLRHATSLVTVPTLLLYTSSEASFAMPQTACALYATYGEPGEPAGSADASPGSGAAAAVSAPGPGGSDGLDAVPSGQEHGAAFQPGLDLVPEPVPSAPEEPC